MYFIYVIGPSSKTLGAFFSLINLISLTQLATIQLKNLTKTIKTFIMIIVFYQKNIYFTTKEPKIHVL